MTVSKQVKEAGLLRRNQLFYGALLGGLALALGGIITGFILLGDSWFQLLMDEEDSELAKKRMNEVWVPIKIIETSQPEVVSEITIATNLQTSIAATDIQGSTQDAKDVEQYFEQTARYGVKTESSKKNADSTPEKRK